MDLNTYSFLLSIKNPHSENCIYSVCILYDENNNSNYVISSEFNDYMKIWDFTGIQLRSFGQINENIYFIDTYYEIKQNKYYIINGNNTCVESYTFEDGKLYNRFKGIPNSWHKSVVVNEKNEQPILIESDGNGYIRMWEFHSANLIKKILSSLSLNLIGICLWNDEYLFASGNDNQIKLFNLNSGECIKSLKEHTNVVCTLEKINHPKYGECLISQGIDGKLILWSHS